MKLQGKGIIVTGGGSGIGEAIAATFAAEGAEVVSVGRDGAKLDAAKAAAGEAGARIHPMPCDVSDAGAAARVAAAAAEKLGKIDILAQSAGVNVPDRALEKLSVEDFHFLVDVNLNGAFHMIHAVLPLMRARQDGLVLNVSSVAGVRASVLGGSGYSASKFGLTALSHSIGLEEGKNGIRCCVICPGEVNTPILDKRPVVPSAERRAKMLQPEDLAAAALMVACLPPRATVNELIINPTVQSFS